MWQRFEQVLQRRQSMTNKQALEKDDQPQQSLQECKLKP